MIPKERMCAALRHAPVDRLPTQINYTGGMGETMAGHFDVEVDDLPDLLGNHMVRVDLSFPTRLSADGTQKFDWWGVGFDTGEEGYFPSHTPLTDDPDLDRFAWPDPHEPALLDEAETIIAADAGRHFITPNFGWALFERAWSLRGLDTLMMDMVLDPGYVEKLLDRIVDIQLVLIRAFSRSRCGRCLFRRRLRCTEEHALFARHVAPVHRTAAGPALCPFRERGLPILMHSDGQIQEVLPDLVEIGLTTLNPVQPEVLDHNWLHEQFGGRLSFYGGVSTQTVLPFGTPDEVKRAVAQAVELLAPGGTGLLIAPSHRMMTDIPMANVEAMLEAFRDLQ